MNSTESVTSLLEDRLVEIEGEAGKIRRALDHLGSPNTRAKGSPASPTSNPKRGKRKTKRAGRGKRQLELLEMIPQMPGASPNELADAMGIITTQVYGLLRQAQERGLIVKKGQGFEIVKRDD